jgi:hypothetical protein
MARQSRSVNTDDGPVAAFAADLRALRVKAGSPSYREMEKRANVSYAVLSRADSGYALPTWATTEAYVKACGDDPGSWRVRWERTRAAVDGSRIGAAARTVDDHAGLDPLEAGTPGEFLRSLRLLKVRHGDPSSRELSRRAQLASSTVADVFNPARVRLPNWWLVEKILNALHVGGDDLVAWRQAWTRAAAGAAGPQHQEFDGPARSLLPQAIQLGVEGLYATRAEALQSFAEPLEREIKKGQLGRVWIVGSSMKGFVQVAIGQFDGGTVIDRVVHAGCDLRLVCTHPTSADVRAEQEGRQFGAIYQEIRLNLAHLKRNGVRRENVRYYKGAPTVFAICTSDRMLLNPYPYGSEAFRNFTMIVHKMPNPDTGIFHQYLQKHFEQPWRVAEEINPIEWMELDQRDSG